MITIPDKKNIKVKEKELIKWKITRDILILLGLTLWFLGLFQQIQVSEKYKAAPWTFQAPLRIMEVLPLLSTQLIISGLSFLILCLGLELSAAYRRRAFLQFFGKPLLFKRSQLFLIPYIMLLLLGIPRFSIGLLLLMGFRPPEILGIFCANELLFYSFGNGPRSPLPFLINFRQLFFSFLCGIILWSFLFYILAYLPARKRGYALRDAFLYEDIIWYKTEK